MILNEPVVAVVGVVVSVLTVLMVDVNGVVVAVAAVEADDVVTVESDAVVNGVEVIVLSAKHKDIIIIKQPYACRPTDRYVGTPNRGSGCTLFLSTYLMNYVYSSTAIYRLFYDGDIIVK